ncbi:hypothetical protein [Mycobacterium sp. ELW1]|uniref:hypothetical protein n=1 Tax=Mycobacterium sp. ELW1 TaxID=1547487 RepID=UPI002570A984|nr:hypothetical protein [Mycobacterium sp. ELW1]
MNGITTVLTDPTRGESAPNRLWTLTNAGEATPDILSPLCWSLWGTGVEFASRAGIHDFGVLPASALVVPDDPNQWSTACFFGRQAMNVDRARELAGLLPGMTGDDFERDLLGSVRPDATPPRAIRNDYPSSPSRPRWCCCEAGQPRATSTRDKWRGGAALYCPVTMTTPRRCSPTPCSGSPQRCAFMSVAA